MSYGKATSYLPVIDLLKSYFRIGDRDEPPRDPREGDGQGSSCWTAPWSRRSRRSSPSSTCPVDDPQWQALDPPQRRQRTLDAVKRLLLREAQVQPLLVVFEDLHWIDSETQALLDSLVESLPPARLLLLVNYRPEYEHRWGSKTSYTQLRLDPLPPESAVELLRGLLGADRTIEPLTPILIERTEGNPFFLEETVRALVETKALVGERGAYRLAKVLTDIQVPRHGPGDPGRPDRPPLARGQAPAPVGRGHRQGRALRPAGGDRRASARRSCAEGSPISRRPSSSTRRASSPISSTRSSTRSPTRWRTAACSTSGGASSTRGSWRRSRRSTGIASASRSSGSPITPLRGELWEKAVHYLRQAGLKAAARSALPDARGLVRAGAGRPRGAAGEPVHARAGLRHPPRAAAGAEPSSVKSGGCWSACARPRPSPSG